MVGTSRIEAFASASRRSSATTAADFSASPGRIADLGPSTDASSSLDSVASIRRVFDPPPSTPATISFIRQTKYGKLHWHTDDTDGAQMSQRTNGLHFDCSPFVLCD